MTKNGDSTTQILSIIFAIQCFLKTIKMEFQEKTEPVFIPDELIEKAENARSKLLPAKSSERYLKQYNSFCNWRKANHIVGVDERVMLAYFEDQYKNSKPTCLWSYYAMIRSCLLIHEKVDIKRFVCFHRYFIL